MAPKNVPPPKRKIIHLILKHLRDRAPREVFNDDIASALDLKREQVRNSLRQYLRDHPGVVEESSPYFYVWVGNDAHPVSAQPSMQTLPPAAMNRGTDIAGSLRDGENVPTFRFLSLTATLGEVLLQDQDRNVWKAVLL